MISALAPGKDAPTDPSSATIIKKKHLADFTEETKNVVEEAQTLVSNKNLDGAVEKLLNMEKKARLAGDTGSVNKCCSLILKIYQKAKDYDNLNKYVALLCKRRSQSEKIQGEIISQGANSIVPSIKSNVEKERLIQTLREISAGKIAVEVIRAQLTMTLSKMKEKEGKVEEACKLIQEETPETYSSMEKRSKIEYLLEQVRLCLATKDYIRAKILSNKVNRSTLEEFENLKIKFYRLLVDFYHHERDALELAKAFLAIYRSRSIVEDVQKHQAELKSAVIMLGCSPYSSLQVDLIQNLLRDERFQVKEMEIYKDFLTHFVTEEVAQWPLPEHTTIASHPLMAAGEQKVKAAGKNKDNKGVQLLSMEDDEAWIYRSLFDRVIEHDIRVVSKYYSEVYLDKLASMLNLDPTKTEDYISDMVSNAGLKVKIDRSAGIVVFEQVRTPDETLTEWTDKISELLGLVDKTCHLIHKENMLNDAKGNKK